MTGKEKCKLLKQIRQKLATDNGIDYEPANCTQKEDCLGTCPLCDSELEYLTNEIKKRKNSKININALNLLLKC